MNRPHTTVVLASSADGKIADTDRSPARFSSAADRAHLEAQIARVDAVLFGAATLRAYGTALPIANPQLLEQRRRDRKAPQPVQIVCSASGNLNPEYPFFRQPIPRWLLTTEAGAERWQALVPNKFEQLLVVPADKENCLVDWTGIFVRLGQLNIRQLAILGGGQLVATLFAENLVDELWLTICPLILGGAMAPTPVDGLGLSVEQAKRLDLLEVKTAASDVFLHYRLQRSYGL